MFEIALVDGPKKSGIRITIYIILYKAVKLIGHYACERDFSCFSMSYLKDTFDSKKLNGSKTVL